MLDIKISRETFNKMVKNLTDCDIRWFECLEPEKRKELKSHKNELAESPNSLIIFDFKKTNGRSATSNLFRVCFDLLCNHTLDLNR